MNVFSNVLHELPVHALCLFFCWNAILLICECFSSSVKHRLLFIVFDELFSSSVRLKSIVRYYNYNYFIRIISSSRDLSGVKAQSFF